MHNGALKKWALALTFWLALHTSSLRAQIFTNDLPLQAVTTGSNPVDFEFRSDGTLIAKGNLGVGSLLTGDLGAGTRMLWFPSLGAFRAGGVSGTQWNTSNIGQYSVAMGQDTTASGNYSIAIGGTSTASADGTIALGMSATADNYSTIAIGQSTASGANSTAIGVHNTASGFYSTALGGWCGAYGAYSTTMNGSNLATGNYSTASGYYTTSSAYASFVVGMFNVGGTSGTSWVRTDPLFEVGNGSNSGYGNPDVTGPSDAFVVYKNGNAALQGTLQVAPGGDIPMYTGE